LREGVLGDEGVVNIFLSGPASALRATPISQLLYAVSPACAGSATSGFHSSRSRSSSRLEILDRRLLEAAIDLVATRLQRFAA